MKNDGIFVGMGNYNPPVLKPVAVQPTNSLMATSNVEGGASITNWSNGGTDIAVE